jgi:hypothetical protein
MFAMSLPESGTILSIATDALRQEQQRLELEQAVANIDSLREIGLHPILESGFFDAGLGVLRERPYPGTWMHRPGKRSIVPTLTERDRCDIVLTDHAGQSIADEPTQRRAGLEDDLLSKDTLFADPAHRVAPAAKRRPRAPRKAAAPDPAVTAPAADLVAPDDAYWLEVKLVGQFCTSRGIPGPNRSYGVELTSAVYEDCQKLAADPVILRGGLLLVVYAQDQRTAEHDLLAGVHGAWSRGASSRSPMLDGFRLVDRIGNQWCCVGLIERQAGASR